MAALVPMGASVWQVGGGAAQQASKPPCPRPGGSVCTPQFHLALHQWLVGQCLGLCKCALGIIVLSHSCLPRPRGLQWRPRQGWQGCGSASPHYFTSWAWLVHWPHRHYRNATVSPNGAVRNNVCSIKAQSSVMSLSATEPHPYRAYLRALLNAHIMHLR